MSALPVVSDGDFSAAAESPKVGDKRKRASSSAEEGDVDDIKRYALPNGSVRPASPVSETETDEREIVAILDAGAQYGKVRYASS